MDAVARPADLRSPHYIKMVPISQYWLPTLEAVGIATNPDAYSSRTVGGFFSYPPSTHPTGHFPARDQPTSTHSLPDLTLVTFTSSSKPVSRGFFMIPRMLLLRGF